MTALPIGRGRGVISRQSEALDDVPFFADAICTLALAVMFALPAAADEPRPSPEARVHFKAGVAALKRRRWDDAYSEFKQAYSITPRWTILGNLGIAAQHLERDGEAIESMDQYLERGKGEIPASERAEVRGAIEALRGGSAEVTIEVAGTFSVVDSRTAEPDVINKYGPFEGKAKLFVRAGQHMFKIEGAYIEVPVWRVTLLAGDSTSHTFVEHQPPPPVERAFKRAPAAEKPSVEVVAPSYTSSYILWGAGSAAAVAATMFALHADRLQEEADSDFAAQCPFGATGVDGCEQVTRGSERAANWRTAGVITGAAALGVLVTGTVLYFAGDSTVVPAGRPEADIQPWVSPLGIGVVGRF